MAKPTLTLRTYHSVIAFRDRAEPFLLQQEAANNLMLGLISGLIDTPSLYAEPPYLATVEADGEVATAFLRTPPYRLIMSTSDHPAALQLVAANLHDSGTALPGVTGPLDLARSFASVWQELADIAWSENRLLRVYAVSHVRPVLSVPGSLRQATAADRDRLIDWFSAFAIEAALTHELERIAHGIDTRLANPQGGIWYWEVDGAPVSLVGGTGLTPHGIRIGPVYTPPEHRRRGYGSAATAAVSQLLLDRGRRFVFLYTDLSNATANHIYQGIGYEPVGDTVDIDFTSSREPA
jgi:hypothetical protein